jgi:hypothetical protein
MQPREPSKIADENPDGHALWCILDRLLDASASALDIDEEAAGYAMMAALVIGDRIAVSDETLYWLRGSAVTKVRLKRSHRLARKPR